MRILITGGTGLLGTRFVEDAVSSPEHELIILSRREHTSDHPQVFFARWDGRSIAADEISALGSGGPVDVVMNLAGKNIGDHSWSEQNKAAFLRSRLDATGACVQYMKGLEDKPALFLSSSAVGYYGADNPDICDESSPASSDFLGELCAKWEAAAADAGVRTVLLRTAVVLDREGGVLPQMLTPFKLGLGGVIGSGEQGFPWMHVKDWVRATWHIIENEEIEGPVNLVAPEIVDNRALTNTLKKVLRRPAFFKVPKFALKLGLGERSVLVWGGQKVLPQVLLQHGFSCQFGSLEEAIRDLV